MINKDLELPACYGPLPKSRVPSQLQKFFPPEEILKLSWEVTFLFVSIYKLQSVYRLHNSQPNKPIILLS